MATQKTKQLLKKPFFCQTCDREIDFPKSIIKKMKFCPHCGCRIYVDEDDIRTNIFLSVRYFIDKYGLDYVINAIQDKSKEPIEIG